MIVVLQGVYYVGLQRSPGESLLVQQSGRPAVQRRCCACVHSKLIWPFHLSFLVWMGLFGLCSASDWPLLLCVGKKGAFFSSLISGCALFLWHVDFTALQRFVLLLSQYLTISCFVFRKILSFVLLKHFWSVLTSSGLIETLTGLFESLLSICLKACVYVRG